MPERYPALRLAALADEIARHVASPRKEVLDQLLKHAGAAANKHISAVRGLAQDCVFDGPLTTEGLVKELTKVALPDGDLLLFTNGIVSRESKVTREVYEAWRARHNPTWPVPQVWIAGHSSAVAKPKRKPGRRPGQGAYDDSSLLEEMRRLVESGEVKSRLAAAEKVADKAQGIGWPASVKRLTRKYRDRYESESN